MLDIISKRGETLPEKTLADRILKDFSIVKIKKAIIKVPNLEMLELLKCNPLYLSSGKVSNSEHAQEHALSFRAVLDIRKKNPNKGKKNLSILKSEKDNLTTASIVNILIKTALEKAKREKKQKAPSEGKKRYKVIKEGFELNANGGYGTISKGYGVTPKASYIDYGKLFSYLGKFRATQPYENMAEHLGALNKAAESGSFALVDKETMDKGTKYIRYFYPKVPVDKTSLVPIVPGMSSAEWEEFKNLMRFDTVMYLLKISSA